MWLAGLLGRGKEATLLGASPQGVDESSWCAVGTLALSPIPSGVPTSYNCYQFSLKTGLLWDEEVTY